MAPTVLITGCSSGIGRATAHAFRDDGWTVYATARDPAQLTALAEAGATTTALDVTTTEDVHRVVDRIIEEQGRLDCLINNAGYGQTGPLEDVPVEDVQRQYDVNVFGPHRLMRAVAPVMRERGTGTIINVSSSSDRFPFAGSGVYCGSKSAVTTLSQAVRQELQPYGIDVVIIEPSFVATDFFDRMRAELDDLDRTTAYVDLYRLLEQLQAITDGGPGIASPETVAETMREAATSESPQRRYTVGSLARVGAVLGTVLPQSWRTPAMRAGLRIATSRPAQRLLERWNASH